MMTLVYLLSAALTMEKHRNGGPSQPFGAYLPNCLFSQRGYLAYFPEDDQIVSLALFNSTAFDYIFKTTLGRFGYPEFLVGILKKMPIAEPNEVDADRFGSLARMGWSKKRNLDTVEETSHAFLLPAALRARLPDL